ncbi:hypothetical protein A8A54_19045 [Brucella pseudogrignonensis]|uniref:5-oxoprolinase subunit C family protein n=1 Tax=Brucella pseudogrignonensis TaxID=419475 RepID=UPI0007DA7448|nr:biotin-dependent carboxyltransferase family protein [Brucella pseudogrignonensis]ANG98706.1 hypothetical protein A8A54_19045 [Brucella pseudogrignonensis]
MIKILSASPFASVQDMGRTGYRAQGVGVAGAMDGPALRAANLLVGNSADAAGIETTSGALKLRFATAALFATTGAPAMVTLDGIALPNHWCQVAEAGQVLEILPSKTDMWSYLAISGGIDLPETLGSRSTDFKIGLGGAKLAAGAKLPLAPTDLARLRAVTALGGFGVAPRPIARDENGLPVVRVIPAREYDEFPPDSQQAFWDQPWTIGREINRMGYRLSGPELKTLHPLSLPSYGILPGVVQVPSGGQPIVQLAEANTCGGYPKMGVVIQTDLPALVQTRTGGAVRMQRATPEQALAARAGLQGWLAGIESAANEVMAWA